MLCSSPSPAEQCPVCKWGVVRRVSAHRVLFRWLRTLCTAVEALQLWKDGQCAGLLGGELFVIDFSEAVLRPGLHIQQYSAYISTAAEPKLHCHHHDTYHRLCELVVIAV